MKRLLALLALLVSPLAFATNPAVGAHFVSSALVNAFTYTSPAVTTATGSSYLLSFYTAGVAGTTTINDGTNTYTLLSPGSGSNPTIDTGDGYYLYSYVVLNATALSAHTITVTTTSDKIYLVIFTEITNTTTIDTSAMVYTVPAGLYLSNPVTTTQANDLVVGQAAVSNTGPFATNSGGFTLLDSVASTFVMGDAYESAATTGSYDPMLGITNHTGQHWTGTTVAFEPSGGGGSCTSTAWVNGGTKAIPTASSTSVWLSTGAWGTTPCDGTGTSWWSTSGSFVKQ
jgi:hypothetical protein